MNKQEYLNEISAKTKPAKPKTSNKILSSKFALVGIIGATLFIIIVIIGAIINGSKTSFKDRLFSLILHIDNTIDVIEEYQPNVKSSDLRSDSASLKSVLSADNSLLTKYATQKYNFNLKSIKNSILEEETSYKDALLSDLFDAKITGTLDHIYAQKLTTDISLIQSSEAQIIKTTSDSNLRDILNTSYENLNILYDNFNNFSESK